MKFLFRGTSVNLLKEVVGQNGLERRLLATVRWTVATAVAFPQESESVLAHHFEKGRKRSGGLAQLGERLPCKQEVSGSIPLISTKKRSRLRANSSAG